MSRRARESPKKNRREEPQFTGPSAVGGQETGFVGEKTEGRDNAVFVNHQLSLTSFVSPPREAGLDWNVKLFTEVSWEKHTCITCV